MCSRLIKPSMKLLKWYLLIWTGDLGSQCTVWIFSGFLFLVQFLFPCFFFCKKEEDVVFLLKKKEFAIYNVITYKSECFQSILKHLDENRCIPLYFFLFSQKQQGWKKHFVLNDKMKSCVSYKWNKTTSEFLAVPTNA